LTEWLAREQARAPFFADSAQHGMAYQPQPSDLFIAPYAKCGATWLQQIVHGLRTRGDMHLDDVMRVMPWLEMAHHADISLDIPQPGGFRAFKSHLSWTKIPKGGRYIVSFRDSKDALVSYYNFVNGYSWQADSVSITEFARACYLSHQGDRWEDSYWGHLVSWWEQRHNPDVLLLCYEGMKADLPAAVETIAYFLGIELDQALLNLVVKRASLDSMTAHRAKSTEPLIQAGETKAGFTSPGDATATVNTDRVSDYRAQLPDEVSAEMDAIWQETVEPRTGLASCQALREALA
jgi:hypothetical protein